MNNAYLGGGTGSGSSGGRAAPTSRGTPTDSEMLEQIALLDALEKLKNGEPWDGLSEAERTVVLRSMPALETSRRPSPAASSPIGGGPVLSRPVLLPSTPFPTVASRRSPHSGSAPRARRSRASRPDRGLVDDVQVAVTAAAALIPGTTCAACLWAFLEQLRPTVQERARQEAGGPAQVRSAGPFRMRRGTVLDVRLRVQGMRVTPARSSILWNGSIGNTSFLVEVPADAAPGLVPGEADVRVSGLLLARLHFGLAVGRPDPSMAARDGAAVSWQLRRYRTAFASYASRDRARVAARVQGLRKAGVDVFMDVQGLRSGDRYEAVLEEMLGSRDVFYLFWSREARRSRWVDREWRTALARRGIEYIDPFPLEPPAVAPPPPELGGTLHFDDWELRYTAGRDGAPWWRFWTR